MSTPPYRRRLRLVVQSGLIAAVYVALSLAFAPISYGSVQFRIAEALMLLPALTPAGTIGVTLGCFLANILNPNNLGPVDIIFGTIATGLAALLTRRLATSVSEPMRSLTWKSGKLWLLPWPTILLNALIVGLYLPFLLVEDPSLPIVLFSMLTVGLGELGVTYILGIPLMMGLLRSRTFASEL